MGEWVNGSHLPANTHHIHPFTLRKQSAGARNYTWSLLLLIACGAVTWLMDGCESRDRPADSVGPTAQAAPQARP